jgi:nitrogen fixation/metabolism regulation signal transduction histidine kinase
LTLDGDESSHVAFSQGRDSRTAQFMIPAIEYVSCDDQQIQVDVIDTGSEMSQQVRDNLFEPFPTTKSGGMGIGLSVPPR